MNTVICIPTKRVPPVQTLDSYPHMPCPVLVIADPTVYDAHRTYYQGRAPESLQVVRGSVGMGAQSAECYRQAYRAKAQYFFRADDDLTPKSFINHNQKFLDIKTVIDEAQMCLTTLGVSLVGFVNTSQGFRLAPERKYSRTYGLIVGSANLAWSAEDPSLFIDATLYRYEDIYRTAAHRWHDAHHGGDGSVGRVAHIGFAKFYQAPISQSSIQPNLEREKESRDIIWARFAPLISRLDTQKIRFKRFRGLS